MNKRHYEHTLPNIRGSLSNTYMTSAENYSENERKAVVAGEVKEQSVHRHNGARFGCKSAESAGIFV